ncbi:hypothetical protein ACFOYW_18335 [Gryllotalpicola reticulitermitis]|uniref:Uncharacterized protein n=1 Tax=Gryllotalpicola reticulitermitis TaxID=1184153 RepID=A0ABV8QAE6_9MICO
MNEITPVPPLVPGAVVPLSPSAPLGSRLARATNKQLDTLRADVLVALAADQANFIIAASRESLQHQLDMIREDNRANRVDRKMMNAAITEQKLQLYIKLAPGAAPDLDRLREAFITGSIIDELGR